MFNSLSGTITGKFPQKVFLENNGIEWDILCPDTSVDSLPDVGEKARIFTWLSHNDQAMTLFGFASSIDRDLFFDLMKVDGLGPKSAVKIMSNIERNQLIEALDKGDLAVLEKIPGMGKKTAAKVLLQLKGKLTLTENETVVRIQKKTDFDDVVVALSNMGYDRKKVEETVSVLVENLKSNSDFTSKSREGQEEILFRQAIVSLAN